MKLKNTCFFDIFLCQNFLSCEFDSVFMVLGAQNMVVVVSYGKGMLFSFKMSHEEAL